MSRLFARVALAVTAALFVAPAQAQVTATPAAPPPPAYYGNPYQPYTFAAPTPDDAYRDGLINRWELEQLAGPLPQALQGPPANGSRGGDGDGGKD